MMMRIGVVIILLWNVVVYASDTKLLAVDINVRDKPALQRGARLYMNYCSGCHALRYLRYSRMAQDIGITKFTGEVDSDLLKSNLLFTRAKIHDPINISLPETDARQWFGRVPPDLSLPARERGSAWIYTYLKSFYADAKRPFGANNLLVPDVSMPNILAPLSGTVVPLDGVQIIENESEHFNLVLVKRGQMTQHQFDSALVDLVTFLTYVAEPSQLVRYRIGGWVIGFLCVFLMFAYFLKKSYWRKI